MKAKKYAHENSLRIIARVFEYTDSESAEDYTGPNEGAHDESPQE